MPETVRRLRVFVASPGDVSAERESLARVVDELNIILSRLVPERHLVLELIRWETHVHPGAGEGGPQRVVNEQIGPFDIFVGIMWKRFGTPTDVAKSGTEEEFRNAYDKWKKTGTPQLLMYFCQEPLPIATIAEVDQLKKVVAFREELKTTGLVASYPNAAQFADIIRPHLIMVLGEKFSGASSIEDAERVGRVALDREISPVRERALELARTYERIRATLDRGDERTRKMEAVMSEMFAVAPLIYPMLTELAHSDSPGQRLLAIAILQQTPTLSYYDWLAERFRDERPFVAYHAGVALFAAAKQSDPQGRDFGMLRDAIFKAKRLLGDDKTGTDREGVLSTAALQLLGNPVLQSRI